MSNSVLDLSKEFAGRRAIVTGGSRGIGAAIAQRVIDGGANVVVVARMPRPPASTDALLSFSAISRDGRAAQVPLS